MGSAEEVVVVPRAAVERHENGAHNSRARERTPPSAGQRRRERADSSDFQSDLEIGEEELISNPRSPGCTTQKKRNRCRPKRWVIAYKAGNSYVSYQSSPPGISTIHSFFRGQTMLVDKKEGQKFGRWKSPTKGKNKGSRLWRCNNRPEDPDRQCKKFVVQDGNIA